MKKDIELFSLSKIKPKQMEELDSVMHSKQYNDKRLFDVLMEAMHYYNQMDDLRKERERNYRYYFGHQWDDLITIKGETITEAEYIKRQGKVPLINNLMSRIIDRYMGVFRSQNKEPICTARDRDEQSFGETMSVVLQCNQQLNQMSEIMSYSFLEFLLSGLTIVKKTYGWRNGKEDCWTDIVDVNRVGIDNNMRDLRGWDVSFITEVHDISPGELYEEFATSPEEYYRLRNIYKLSSNKSYLISFAESFGYSRYLNYDFLLTNDPGRCRVIEVWRKEQKPRYRCHDLLKAEVYKIEISDYQHSVVAVNESRLAKAREAGIKEEDVPLIEATWFMDNYWYYYYLSPFGDVLREGESPYEHKSHPYVFKLFPGINGKVRPYASNHVDQQRYINRLFTLQDWILQASAKGVLLIPEDCLVGHKIEDFAETWSSFNGVIAYKPSKSGQVPRQVSSNSTNIGIVDLLNIQLKLMEDISGITGALQGKPGFSGQSASHYNMQIQNATTGLLNMLETFGSFVVDGAYKDVKNMQQFYTDKRIFKIAGKRSQLIEYDPALLGDVEFDLSIVEGAKSGAYREMGNDLLLQLWEKGAITVEQFLENIDLPFADNLLQSIQAQREEIQANGTPGGFSPELMSSVQNSINQQAAGNLPM